jgi:hypothetical protein
VVALIPLVLLLVGDYLLQQKHDNRHKAVVDPIVRGHEPSNIETARREDSDD